MKKRLFFVILSLLIILPILACDSETEQRNGNGDEHEMPDAAHTARNSLDYHGTYSGVLPCADCEGIETEILLMDDGTYAMRTRYLGKSDSLYVQVGSYHWNEAGNTIRLEGVAGTGRYFVGENNLIHLDSEGEMITGDMSDEYILPKKQEQTEVPVRNQIDKGRWLLVELRGQSVDQIESTRKPYMVFDLNENKISGNAGCNNFNGSFELSEGNRISFSRVAATKMACPDMQVENELFEIFEMADNYTISDGKLMLNRARMAPLAVFEAHEGE